MKKLLLFCLFITAFAQAQIINFPDANFKAKLLSSDPSNTVAKDLVGNNIKIDANSDGEIEVSEAMQVYYLDVSISSISSVDGISNFTNLQNFYCHENQISSLDVSSLTNLQTLECYVNQIVTLDVSMLMNLTHLICSDNQLTSLNVNGLSNLVDLRCYINQLTSLDVSSLSSLYFLDCSSNIISMLDVSNLLLLETLNCNYNLISSLELNGAINITSLNCGYNKLTTLNLSGLTKIHALLCSYNELTSLDVSGIVYLTQLDFSYNNKPLIDVSVLTNLNFLSCAGNQYTSLDVSALSNLFDLYCYDNQLTSLDVNNLTNLIILHCAENQITSLDVSNLVNLGALACYSNQIQILDVTNLTQLQQLFCSNNQLTTLDVSNSPLLYDLVCSDNLFTSLYIKNGSNENTLEFYDNPNLQYICADDSQIPNVQTIIDSYGYTSNCHANSYCSFVPTGTFYTVQGNNKYDNDNNGCDVADINLPNLKLLYTNGTTNGGLICDTNGSYFYDVQAGIHTITPSMENPSYFTISPTTTTVDFPTQASPFLQDYCVVANGVHPDLEIMVLPMDVARPGFDASYTLIYKNKGTITQSGTVNLEFDDAVLDFVAANPATTNQSVNNLSWDFTNLLPFETREISFSMNLNSPTETPALNSGNILDYTATITSPATDDTPADNTITFHQEVLNSYDPNDKTCLEGTTISPAMVGEYVHYVIRFENTGTFPAQNIVVKDMIDLAKFDINTLIPIKGSHEFVTNITAGNKVEFIFENINLPFDDANNDGFVAFKIKTKPNLVLGDTFENSANIYFDYNFPIVTNTASTTVQTLGTSDFEFAKYFTVYPNPASGILNLASKNGITVNNIGIYNTLGQLVIAIPNAQSVSTIDVSKLKTGNYFIKMITDKGTSNAKFIKN
ncbi:MAG: T9SS type A sorting domain-containing protein [Bacteroidota bacterium]